MMIQDHNSQLVSGQVDEFSKQRQSTYESPPYTEFFSWGSDAYGQLALAHADEDNNSQSSYHKNFFQEPRSLSFDIIIKQISCGDQHAAFVSGDGFLFSVGRNQDGQLGVNDPSLQKSSAPLLVETLPLQECHSFIVSLSCGGNHTAVVLSNGDLWSWGDSKYGQLGQNLITPQFLPAKVKTLDYPNSPKFTTVSCGKKHTLALDNQGQVYSCGDNTCGQLGIPIGQDNSVLVLERISNLKQQIIAIAAGKEHSLILDQKGHILSSGNNVSGCLGSGDTYSSSSFLPVLQQGLQFSTVSAGRHSAALTQDGKFYVWGPVFINEAPLLVPQELRSNKRILSMCIGEKLTAIIDEDQHLYTWGTDNTLGQLGRRDANQYSGTQGNMQLPQLIDALETKKISRVSVGLDFAIALGQDYDQFGQTARLGSQQEDNQGYQTVDIQSYNQTHILNSQQNHAQKPQNQMEYEFDSRYERQTYQSRTPQEINVPQIYDRQKDYERNDARSATPTQNSVSAYHSNKDATPGSSKTTELLKQLDILREENFQLKQKQRQHQMVVNELKAQNDQLIEHSENELERMHKFIDDFMKEVENQKVQQQKDFEKRLKDEREKGQEEIKRKFHQQQNEIEHKLDRLQQEILGLRSENLALSQAKQTQGQKINDLVRENDMLNQQLKSLQLQLIQQKQLMHPHSPQMSNSQLNRTPANKNEQGFNQIPHRHERTPQSHNLQQALTNSSQHTNKHRPMNGVSNVASVFSSGHKDQQIDSQNNAQKFYESVSSHQQPYSQNVPKKSVLSNTRSVERNAVTPSNEERKFSAAAINLPVQQMARYPPQPDVRKTYISDGKSANDLSHQVCHNVDHDQSFPRSPLEYPVQNMPSNKYAFYDENPSRSYQPISQSVTVGQHSKNDSLISVPQQEEPSQQTSVSDVKSRLLKMQKNKEELERKLKSYEAKLRQHI